MKFALYDRKKNWFIIHKKKIIEIVFEVLYGLLSILELIESCLFYIVLSERSPHTNAVERVKQKIKWRKFLIRKLFKI